MLNKAGRVCLARLIFSSILIYSMQMLYFLESVYTNIDKVTRDFI